MAKISQAFAQERAIIEQEIAVKRQAIADIDDESDCERIADELRVLYEQLNALTPASRLLLPELLSQVFLAYATSLNFEDNGTPRPRATHLGWSNILQICRYWRCVAIATSQLWAQVTLTRKDYVETALQRSAGSPLSIRSSLSPHKNVYGIYPTLQRETFRIRTLDLTVTDPVLRSIRKLKLEPQTFSASAPLLEELRLAFTADYKDRAPAALTSLDMPRLRSIAIIRGSPSLAFSLARPTVTSLEIQFCCPVVSSDLLDLLAGMPLLQHLEFRKLDHISPLPIIGARAIPLPHLKYVHLCGEAASVDMAHLLQSLSFSEKTHIRFQCFDRRSASPVEQYERALSIVTSRAFASHLPEEKHPMSVRPRVLELKAQNLRFKLWGPEDSDGETDLQQSAYLDVDFGCILDHLSSPFLNHFDLTKLSLLSIRAHDMPSDSWFEFLSAVPLPELEHLHLSNGWNGRCQRILTALGSPLPAESVPTLNVGEQGRGTPSERYLLPALKSIELHGVFLEEVFRRSRAPETALLPELIAILTRRAEAGCKLKTLTIYFTGRLDSQVSASLKALSVVESVELHQWREDDTAWRRFMQAASVARRACS